MEGKFSKRAALRAGCSAVILVFAASAAEVWLTQGGRSLLWLLPASGAVLSLVVALLGLRHWEGLERRSEGNRAELQQLSARLLETEEEGRRRLSRELHDEIGQALALLQIEISQARKMLPAQSSAARDCLERAGEMAERTVETIRHISVLLRPALLDDLGLEPALQFQLDDFVRRSGIQARFVPESVSGELPDAVKTCVYRTVQEALHNCEKHSGATKVRVSVRRLSDSLVAEVEDNGRGFALNPQRMPSGTPGLGLLGIRERVAAAGGSLVIDAAPGQGARIAIRIPLVPPRIPSRPREVSV